MPWFYTFVEFLSFFRKLTHKTYFLGFFWVTEQKPEFKVSKSSNSRWRIQYGGPLLWLKYWFLNIVESIFVHGGFWGPWLRFYSQSLKIYEFKMADPIWRTSSLAKIFIFEHFWVNIYTRGFLKSLITILQSKFENLYEFKMVNPIWRTYFLAKIFKIFVFGHYGVNMRTGGFLESPITNLKSNSRNSSIQDGGSNMADVLFG